MTTVEKIEQLVQRAESLGYGVRHEYFGGTGGGVCEFGGKRWLFLDLAMSPAEQLQYLEQTLTNEPLFQLGSHTRAA